MANKKIIATYNITNIINYLRKSRQDVDRERKTGEDTLHEQKKLMDRVLNEYGTPFEQRSEVGSGDKISTRPVFQEIIREIEQGKFDAIAVKEISRMGRGSYTDMGIIYDLITERNIYIVTPWKIYNPKNPTDLRQIRFELFMSREEFETTRERLVGGRHNAALEGKWVAGPPPFGFNYNQNTKKLEINEDEAEVVRSIFDFYANGIIQNGKRKLVQFRALSTYLRRVGIKTPRGKDEWHPNYLRIFLGRETFIGTVKYNTTKTIGNSRVPTEEADHIIVPNSHPAIIDSDTWKKTQDRINNRSGPTNTKLDFDPSELAGICVCKICGRKMIKQSSKSRYTKVDGTKTIYHKEFLWCKTQGCTFVKYRPVEEDLLETLKYLSDLDSATLSKHLDHLVINQIDNKPAFDIKENYEKRKADLERRMDFIFDKYESRIYTDEMFLERKTEIDKEKEELERININEHIEEPEEVSPDIAKEKIESVLDLYEKTSYKSDKNTILRTVFDRVEIEVLEKGRGRRPAVHRITPYLKSTFFKVKGA